MIRKDQVFIVDVVVTNPTRETMVSIIISQLVGAIAEHNAIVNIRKYRGLQEGHHFILFVMEVHSALGHDMNCFIRECVCLFHDRQSGGNLSLFFCIQFFRQRVSIVL